MLVRRLRGAILLFITGCTVHAAPARVRPATLRDFEGYAVACCLSAQEEPYLRDQGDGWASVIVQRSSGDLDALAEIAGAVRRELALGKMTVIRAESSPDGDKRLPVLYCAEIIDSPGVHAALVHATRVMSAERPQSDQ